MGGGGYLLEMAVRYIENSFYESRAAFFFAILLQLLTQKQEVEGGGGVSCFTLKLGFPTIESAFIRGQSTLCLFLGGGQTMAATVYLKGSEVAANGKWSDNSRLCVLRF